MKPGKIFSFRVLGFRVSGLGFTGPEVRKTIETVGPNGLGFRVF